MILNSIQNRVKDPYITDYSPIHKQRMKKGRFSHVGMPAFEGLTKKLSCQIFEKPEEIKKMVDKYTETDGVVGNLPHEWIQKIPEKNRGEVIKQLYKDLKATVINSRNPNSRKKP